MTILVNYIGQCIILSLKHLPNRQELRGHQMVGNPGRLYLVVGLRIPEGTLRLTSPLLHPVHEVAKGGGGPPRVQPPPQPDPDKLAKIQVFFPPY